MVNGKRSLFVGGVGAALICAAFGAQAQDNASSGSGAVIGPPQLKDFQLRPQRQEVAPTPNEPVIAPVRVAPPPPTATAPTQQPTAQRPAQTPAAAPQQAPARVAATPAAAPRRQPTDARPTAAPAETGAVGDAPATAGPAPTGTRAPTTEAPAIQAPAPVEPAEAVPVADGGSSTSFWLYALPVAVLALLGVAIVRRRRRASDIVPVVDLPARAAAPPKPEPAPAPAPRPDPVPRPWLELTLKAERASFTDTETVVNFELEIANKGGSAARNLRIDVKMFNAGAEQDREIGTFFKTAGRESTKLNLPMVEAGVTGVIHGSVRMAREEMRAVRLDERLLYVPVIAVNGLYDWGEGRTGQTSRSYVIGREAPEPSDKMGAFRVDQGPRIWRTIGQRAHTLEKRV